MNSVLSAPSARFALPVLAAALALVMAAPTTTAQTPVTAEALEGVWRVTKVVSPDGALVEQVPTGDVVTTNICFGGPDRKTAFITCSSGGTLIEMPWERPGLKLAYG